MNRFFAAAIFAGLSAASATAADLPARTYTKAPAVVSVAYNWTGFYFGGSVGGHWGRDRLTANAVGAGYAPAAAAEVNAGAAGSLYPKGFIGGAQIGYNWQVNNVVVGVEADGSWLSGKAARTVTFLNALVLNPGDIMTNSTNATWLATVRGRLGVAFDRTLLYATGGVAFGEVKTTDTFCVLGCPAVAGVSSSIGAATTRTGWTAGVGVEHAFDANWSLKLEYLYVDLGKFNTNIPTCAACVGLPSDVVMTHRYTDNIVRAGINYRFGGPVVARY